MDRYLGLPQGLPAWAANRFIDAVQSLAWKLQEFATMEYVPGDFGGNDRHKIVYSGGYEPYMDTLMRITGADRGGWELEGRARRDLHHDDFNNPVSDSRIEARMRAIETEDIRALIVDGDAEYTPAAAGKRYTVIRMNKAGHLSAHTDQEPPAEEAGIREWKVSPLNFRQANRLMRRVGVFALVTAKPTAATTFVGDARESMETTLAKFLIPADEVSAYMAENGIEDTPARREKALRALTTVRFHSK
ncbi:hypothetical protein KGD82_16210 [Nocardiopsis eucommiae]|uniref:Uncharacterized protein n=1 Tax=Nocardiopsis eucommiae TaxID=2831970 RepID=A0A975QJN6_9ACTN|nr:hypothetical protein KGD82_16210 [Nocardiopsis eucommiae]